jgi:hypothetical protein
MDQSNLPPAIFPLFPTNSNNQDHQDDNDTDVVDDILYPFDDNNNDDEDKENASHCLPKLSYGEVVGKCMDLIKTIQNNPAEMTKFFVLMENMVKRYQSGHAVEIEMHTCPSNSIGSIIAVCG